MAKNTSQAAETSGAAVGGKRTRIPLRITDTTLRDAHQSLWATRLRTHDILDIIDVIDSVGYYSLEVWGGATFDVCMRFLRENPWERLRQMRERAKKTPLQMLLRGQNILGYKHYPDDLVDRFVALACENGIDIFRIFDALNDPRNLECAIKSVKAHGGHAQGTLSYTISPVHTVDEYVRVAKEQTDMGIDSLVIKDMAGILSPISAERLVGALIDAIDVPVQMHCHATSGMAVATYVEGVRAGAGAIDCAISVMSGFSSQPPVETMLAIFDETSYHANLDIDALRTVCKYFTNLTPQRQLAHHPVNIIDPEILVHHIPGGMISNLRSQLEQQEALDRLDEVMAELPKTRADLGYPPLVTPTSQIVGVQSVINVLTGKRYSMVTQETRNYVRGLYGRPPASIDPEVKKLILAGEKTISCRPADLLEPMLPQATHDVDPELIQSEEDIVSYCLFPEPAVEYFKWRNLPESERPPIPADLEREEASAAKTEVPHAAAAAPSLTPQDSRALSALLEKVNELGLSELMIRKGNLELKLTGDGAGGVRVPATDEVDEGVQDTVSAEGETPPAAADVPEGPTIDAPLSGTFYRSSAPGDPNLVEEGDKVKAGDAVCIVEAMKLLNQIEAPADCEIVKVLPEHGQSVRKGQPLVAIKL